MKEWESVRKVIPVEQGLRPLFNNSVLQLVNVVRKVIPVEQGLRLLIVKQMIFNLMTLERLFQ